MHFVSRKTRSLTVLTDSECFVELEIWPIDLAETTLERQLERQLVLELPISELVSEHTPNRQASSIQMDKLVITRQIPAIFRAITEKEFFFCSERVRK